MLSLAAQIPLTLTLSLAYGGEGAGFDPLSRLRERAGVTVVGWPPRTEAQQ